MIMTKQQSLDVAQKWIERAERHYSIARDELTEWRKDDSDDILVSAEARVGELAARIAAYYSLCDDSDVEPQGWQKVRVETGQEADGLAADSSGYCGDCKASFASLSVHQRVYHSAPAAQPGRGWRRARLLVGDLCYIIVDIVTDKEVHREAIDKIVLRSPHLWYHQKKKDGFAREWAKRNGYDIVEERRLSALTNIS